MNKDTTDTFISVSIVGDNAIANYRYNINNIDQNNLIKDILRILEVKLKEITKLLIFNDDIKTTCSKFEASDNDINSN